MWATVIFGWVCVPLEAGGARHTHGNFDCTKGAGEHIPYEAMLSLSTGGVVKHDEVYGSSVYMGFARPRRK